MPEVLSKPKLKTYRFDQMAELINDRVDNPAESGVERYVGLEHLDSDSLRIRRWGSVTDVESIKLRFQPGDIIFGKRRVYQRKVAVADFEGICSAHAMVLRAKPDVVLPEFLPFFMQSDHFMQRALEISVGSLSPTINWKTLAKETFTLPPIEEQRRMVDALIGADDVVNKLRGLVESMLVLRQSLIDEATKLGRVTTTIGNHCEMQNGRPFPGDEYCNDSILLLRPGNLGARGYIDWSDEKTKRVPSRYLSEAGDYVLHEGDVLINLTAQSLEDGFMGRICLVTGGEPSLLNQRIGRFRGFSDALLPELLFRCLQSSRFRAHAVSMCEGSKITHLFWSHIARFELPSLDLERQKAICLQLRKFDEQIEVAEARAAVANNIKSYLLADVVQTFRGDH